MKKLLLIGLFVIPAIGVLAQQVIMNSVTGKKSAFELVNCVTGYDDGILIAGVDNQLNKEYTPASFAYSNQNFYLAKINKRGKHKLITNHLKGEAKVVSRTPDNGVVAAGIIFEETDKKRRNEICFIVKFDEKLNKQWEKKFPLDTEISTLYVTKDNRFIFATANDAIIKLDPDGNSLWENKVEFNCSWGSHIKAILENTDGTILIAGNTGGYYSNKKMAIALLNSNGDKLWEKCYEKYGNAYINSVVADNNGGYILAGEITDSINVDMLAFCIDSKGNKRWVQKFDNDVFDKANAIIKTHDGNYLIAGSTFVKSKDETDGWIVKINSNGEKLWSKSIDGRLYDVFTSCSQINDKYYALGGYSMEIKAGEIWNLDMWVVKIKDK